MQEQSAAGPGPAGQPPGFPPPRPPAGGPEVRWGHVAGRGGAPVARGGGPGGAPPGPRTGSGPRVGQVTVVRDGESLRQVRDLYTATGTRTVHRHRYTGTGTPALGHRHWDTAQLRVESRVGWQSHSDSGSSSRMPCLLYSGHWPAHPYTQQVSQRGSAQGDAIQGDSGPVSTGGVLWVAVSGYAGARGGPLVPDAGDESGGQGAGLLPRPEPVLPHCPRRARGRLPLAGVATTPDAVTQVGRSPFA